MKKLFIFGIVLIIFSSFVSAIDTSNLISYYSFDTGANDDYSNNDGTLIGSPDNLPSVLNNGYYFDGANDAIFLGDDTFKTELANNMTICSWVNVTSFPTPEDEIIDFGLNFRGLIRNGGWAAYIYDGTSSNRAESTDNATVNTNRFVCIKSNGVELKLYVNTVNIASSASGYPTTYTGSREFGIWQDYLGGISTTSGSIDELSIWSYDMPDSDMAELWNNNNGFNPLITEGDNESIENTAQVQQIGTTTINSATYITVLSSNFEVLQDNTPLYGAYTLNVESNNANSITCQMNIEGNEIDVKTRTNFANQIGSMSLLSDIQYLDIGNYTQNLRCLKNGPGTVIVSNAIGIGHFLIDESQQLINFNSNNISANVNSGNFELINEVNFTVSNKSNVDEGFEHMLIIEGSMNYENLGTADLMEIYISINDSFNCSYYRRDVSGASTGSVGFDCIQENLTTNATYTIKMYGKANNGNFNGSMILKEFFMSDEEIIGGTGILNGTTFSGATPSLIINVTGGNLNHALANAFSKLSYSLSADITTDAEMYFIIENGDTYESNHFIRTLTTDIGVLIGQDVFPDIPKDTYSVQLWGICPGATCTIEGGSSLGYITDITTTIINSFIVTANDSRLNNSILDFNVTNGATFSSVNGNATVITEENFLNLTIESDTYITKNITNHNASENLSINMCSIYNYGTFVDEDSTPIIGSQVNVIYPNGQNFSTTTNSSGGIVYSVNQYGQTQLGQYKIIFNDLQGFVAPVIFLENLNDTNCAFDETYQIAFSRLFVNVRDQITGSLITENVSVQFVDQLGSFTNYTVTGGLTFVNLTSGSYTVWFDSDNYIKIAYLIDVTPGQNSSLNAYLLPDNYTNTVSMEFVDQNDGSKLEDVSVAITRVVNDTQTQIIVLKTDVTGLIEFIYEPDLEYCFDSSKEGYNNKQFCLSPILRSEYTVNMVRSETTYNTGDYYDLSIIYSPSVFYETNNDFEISFFSPEGRFSQYSYQILYDGSLISSGSGINVQGELFLDTFDLPSVNFDKQLILYYNYTATDIGYKEYYFTLDVVLNESLNGTMIQNRNKTYDLPPFERSLITSAAAILVGGISFFIGGFNVVGLMLLFVYGWLIYIGFTPFWTGIISMILIFIFWVWGSK